MAVSNPPPKPPSRTSSRITKQSPAPPPPAPAKPASRPTSQSRAVPPPAPPKLSSQRMPAAQPDSRPSSGIQPPKVSSSQMRRVSGIYKSEEERSKAIEDSKKGQFEHNLKKFWLYGSGVLLIVLILLLLFKGGKGGGGLLGPGPTYIKVDDQIVARVSEVLKEVVPLEDDAQRLGVVFVNTKRDDSQFKANGEAAIEAWAKVREKLEKVAQEIQTEFKLPPLMHVTSCQELVKHQNEANSAIGQIQNKLDEESGGSSTSPPPQTPPDSGGTAGTGGGTPPKPEVDLETAAMKELKDEDKVFVEQVRSVIKLAGEDVVKAKGITETEEKKKLLSKRLSDLKDLGPKFRAAQANYKEESAAYDFLDKLFFEVSAVQRDVANALPPG